MLGSCDITLHQVWMCVYEQKNNNNNERGAFCLRFPPSSMWTLTCCFCVCTSRLFCESLARERGKRILEEAGSLLHSWALFLLPFTLSLLPLYDSPSLRKEAQPRHEVTCYDTFCGVFLLLLLLLCGFLHRVQHRRRGQLLSQRTGKEQERT